MNIRKNRKKILKFILKIIIVIFAYLFIVYKLLQDDLYTQIVLVFTNIDSNRFFILIIVGLLMFINWFTEALKWRFILQKVEKISILTSLKAVFSGVTLAIFTPNRIGELGGRVFVLLPQNRIKGVLSSSIGSLSQLNITVFMGIIGISLLALFYGESFLPSQKNIIVIVSILIILIAFLLLLLYFSLNKFSYFILKFKYFEKHADKIEFFKQFNNVQLAQILGYSLLRYVIFTTQFYLLLIFFEVDISIFEAYISIASIYLIINIIPSIVLSDIGVRGSVSIFIFGIFSQAEGGIFLTSTFLWLINLVVPAIIGSLVLIISKKL